MDPVRSTSATALYGAVKARFEELLAQEKSNATAIVNEEIQKGASPFEVASCIDQLVKFTMRSNIQETLLDEFCDVENTVKSFVDDGALCADLRDVFGKGLKGLIPKLTPADPLKNVKIITLSSPPETSEKRFVVRGDGHEKKALTFTLQSDR